MYWTVFTQNFRIQNNHLLTVTSSTQLWDGMNHCPVTSTSSAQSFTFILLSVIIKMLTSGFWKSCHTTLNLSTARIRWLKTGISENVILVKMLHLCRKLGSVFQYKIVQNWWPSKTGKAVFQTQLWESSSFKTEILCKTNSEHQCLSFNESFQSKNKMLTQVTGPM